MKRWSRILFICLFALLQSVAPLAHAHVNGDQTNGRVHAVELEHTSFGAFDLAEPALSTSDSPSIGMPHELQREISLDLCGTPPCFTPALPPVAGPFLLFPGSSYLDQPCAQPSPYKTPLSHAPPALA